MFGGGRVLLGCGVCLSVCISVCLCVSVGMICLVVAVFYWAGWELGAVEAISLSILVGSSVDYCVHIVEGYLLAGAHSPPPTQDTQVGCILRCAIAY